MRNDVKRQKQELYRLCVAKSDVLHAQRVCELAIAKRPDDPLLRPLVDSVIVNYAKPFSENRPFGPLPKRWAKFGDVGFKKLHNEIIELRDTIVAHSDLKHKKLILECSPSLPGMPRFITRIGITRLELAHAKLPQARDLCQNLIERLDTESFALIDLLFDHLHVSGERVILEFD